ncbi:hypothetical protein [Algoriphagus sediminis]|uniref:Plug domain-containing protein n=1 Tax=Algoriphagus sediminis TaxID=3057113 RepID=A0ABT7Y898_9BACT|nr:hypothetical protein [Algoriphagus sediminis]MDN3202737.1 hypothetical protein [Algoriphagus sediminis]
MKNLLIIFFLFFSISVFGQEQKRVESDPVLNPSRNVSLALIEQIGSQNESEILQQAQGPGSNEAMIVQQGEFNSGYLNQVGSGLTSELVQAGSSNSASLWLIGQNLSVFTTQNGLLNSINAYVDAESVVGIEAKFSQEGNQNSIDFAIRNSASFNPGVEQNIGISQLGNNHSVTALFENLGAPVINITQNPGFGGAGMSLNVSTLPGFKFPNK